ncbi:MAG: hypothetical protein ABI422_07925 [Sphingomicrobium sp.]
MTEVSRRSFVAGGFALVGACGVPLPALASVERAIPTRRFVDAVGICTHPNWRKDLWGSIDWGSAFLETGVLHTRGKIGRGSPGKAALADLQRLFARGVKICVTVASQSGEFDLAETKSNIDFLTNYVGAQNISAIESANEYNKPASRPADWAAQLRNFQKWLHDTVRANPKLDEVPLVGPSIWGRLTNDYITLGNLETTVDKGCLHYYTGGRRPSKAGKPSGSSEGGGAGEYTLANAIREAKILAPTKPLWITEYGYPVAGPGLPLRAGFITEEAAAKYLIRGLLDAYGEGVEKIYIYSLLDDVQRHPPRYHGLIDGEFRRRPAFFAVKNLMALMFDKGTAFIPGRLDYAVTNGTWAKRKLFQKSDGTFLLTMYQDVDSYNRLQKRDIIVAPVPVGLTLAQPAAKIEVFTPTMDLAAKLSAINAKTITVPVGDHVTVVKITP